MRFITFIKMKSNTMKSISFQFCHWFPFEVEENFSCQFEVIDDMNIKQTHLKWIVNTEKQYNSGTVCIGTGYWHSNEPNICKIVGAMDRKHMKTIRISQTENPKFFELFEECVKPFGHIPLNLGILIELLFFFIFCFLSRFFLLIKFLYSAAQHSTRQTNQIFDQFG